jgi:hypothetical protein
MARAWLVMSWMIPCRAHSSRASGTASRESATIWALRSSLSPGGGQDVAATSGDGLVAVVGVHQLFLEFGGDGGGLGRHRPDEDELGEPGRGHGGQSAAAETVMTRGDGNRQNECRPLTRRPPPSYPVTERSQHEHAERWLRTADFSALACPAGGRRVKGAYGVANAIGDRRPMARRLRERRTGRGPGAGGTRWESVASLRGPADGHSGCLAWWDGPFGPRLDDGPENDRQRFMAMTSV